MWQRCDLRKVLAERHANCIQKACTVLEERTSSESKAMTPILTPSCTISKKTLLFLYYRTTNNHHHGKIQTIGGLTDKNKSFQWQFDYWKESMEHLRISFSFFGIVLQIVLYQNWKAHEKKTSRPKDRPMDQPSIDEFGFLPRTRIKGAESAMEKDRHFRPKICFFFIFSFFFFHSRQFWRVSGVV